MELDDLKNWLAAQDAKLDQVLRLNKTAVRELQLAKTRSALRWLVPGVAFELILAIVAVVWLGSFLFDHLGQPQYFVPGLFLDLGANALLGSCIRQLMAVGSLDYGRPVVAVQKELGQLRVLRIRTTKWTMILSFALWFPAVLVLFKGLLGVDVWRIVGKIGETNANFFNWVAGNVLFGLLMAVALIWISKKYANRVEGSPRLRRLIDDLAGRSLTEAKGSLDSIAAFEAEG
jgi:hypothetical protein